MNFLLVGYGLAVIFFMYHANAETDPVVAAAVKNPYYWGGKLGLSPEHEVKIRPFSKMQGRGIFFNIFQALKPLVRFRNSTGSTEKIRYMLRFKTKNNYSAMARDGKNLDSSKWYDDGGLKIIIHGFCPIPYLTYWQQMDVQSLRKIAEGYASLGKQYNIIIMDWTTFACKPLWQYHYSASSTKIAGEDLAKFVTALKEAGKITSLDNVHLIGFSLGAHVAGIAGSNLETMAGSKVGRITGVDPAGPLFDLGEPLPEDKTSILDPSDAQFVDAIHCNMPKEGVVFAKMPVSSGTLGTSVESGHANFYPNGGRTQPGCSLVNNRVLACSHLKCPRIFAESIATGSNATSCGSWEEFKSGSCKENDKVSMGDPCPTSASGKYYKY